MLIKAATHLRPFLRLGVLPSASSASSTPTSSTSGLAPNAFSSNAHLQASYAPKSLAVRNNTDAPGAGSNNGGANSSGSSSGNAGSSGGAGPGAGSTNGYATYTRVFATHSTSAGIQFNQRRETDRRVTLLDDSGVAAGERLDALKNGRPLLAVVDTSEPNRLTSAHGSAFQRSSAETSRGNLTIVSIPETPVQSLSTLSSRLTASQTGSRAASPSLGLTETEDDGQAFIDSDFTTPPISASSTTTTTTTGGSSGTHRLRKPRVWNFVGLRPTSTASSKSTGLDVAVPRSAGVAVRLLTTSSTAVSTTKASTSRRIGTAYDDLSLSRGTRGTTSVRRHSTSISHTPSADAITTLSESELPATATAQQDASQAALEQGMRDELVKQDEEYTESIYAALERGESAEKVLRMCDAYRHQGQSSTTSTANPPYFSNRGYTAVLIALSAIRQPGGPITSILTTYNEMLEHDVLPTLVTYNIVIGALLERDHEISDAVKRVQKRRRWLQWEQARFAQLSKSVGQGAHSSLNRRHTALKAQEQELDLLAQENNYASAIKLFRSAIVYNRYRSFRVRTYLALLEAAARRGDVAVAIEVWGHHEGVHRSAEKVQADQGAAADDAQVPTTSSTYTPPAVATRMYTLLIQAYANAKETTGVAEVLAEFLAQERRGAINDGRRTGQTERDAQQAERTVVGLFAEVVQAYIGAGDPEAAMTLLTQIAEHSIAGNHSEAGALPPFTKVLITRAVFACVAVGDHARAVQLAKELASGEGLFASALPAEERIRAVAQCAQYLINDALLVGDIEALEAAVALMPGQNQGEGVDTPALLGDETPAHSAMITRTLLLLAAAATSESSTQPYPLATALGLLRALDTPAVRETCHIEGSGITSLTALIKACTEANAPQHIVYVLEFFDQYSQPRTSKPLTANVMREARGLVFGSVKNYDEALAVTALLDRYGCSPSTKDALGLVRRYASTTSTSEWTPERVATTIKIFEVPAAAVEAEALQGEDAHEYDATLDRLVADLASAHIAIPTAELERLMNAVALRKGHEQAESAMVDAFGKEATAPLLSPAAPPTASPIISEPGSETFTAPSEASTAPTSVAPSYRIDRKLSSVVDSHYGPKATSTPLAAYATLKQGLAKGVVTDPFVLARLLQALARLGEEAKVRELYALAHEIIVTLLPAERQLPAWIQVEDLMLIAACHLGHLEQAGMHRARIIEQGVAPSADAYATMISSTKDTTDDASVARELWDESQRYGVKPHLYLYNTIISKLSKARKAETALEFFQKMKAEGMRPSSVTYGAVINACVRVGDVESATTLFQEMQNMPNFKPRVPPYNTMMQMHLQTQPSRELVLHYYNQMIQANVSPSAHTYKLLLDAYGTLQPIDLDAMQKVFDNLCRDRRIDVQGTHWASLIHAYGNVAGQPEKAIEIFESIPSHASTRSKDIEPVCWEAILNVLASAKMADRMEEYVSRMRQQHIRPTAYINNMLIRGYAAVDKLEKSREIFEGMQDAVMGVAAPNNHPALLTSSGQAKPVTTAHTDIVFREPST
ncbi:hypothetical protein QFC22_004507 [Naganishia vaughanmartiniae]|uniref:Uncharacterized protein n=1 Tax=Naganishia vaughanmartiniae TaxID=1424756 RepID=A0ACC2X0C3_9TREE|nr:hypothetical protein QFC22_004507 [Naganishia vaughanmartiniae]